MDESQRSQSLSENLAHALELLTQPLPTTLMLMALIAALGAFGYRQARDKARTATEPEPETLSGLRVLGWGMVPVWLFIVGFILWGMVTVVISFDPANEMKDLRWHVLAFVGLITALGALVSAPLALIRVWTTERQVRISEQGHMTDRISKAVEQLGAEKTVKRADGEEPKPNIEVRLGGLLSLERIAQDSTAYDKGRDHVRVMEILCAYVRENSPASEAVNFPLPDWQPLEDGASPEARAEHEMWRSVRFSSEPFVKSNAREWAESLGKPRADIQMALNIVGRRSPEQRQVEARWGAKASPEAIWVFDHRCPELPESPDDQPHGEAALKAYIDGLSAWKTKIAGYNGYRLDLRNCNLQGADLSHAILSGADLREARMEGANLGRARMEDADLREARMEGASLSWARMQGASLRQARMEGAKLSNARMAGADLRMAQMEGADLRNAQMEGASLRRARMERADLRNARLEGADLSEAGMEGADLLGARMEGADLAEARMEGANLGWARMERADLNSARINTSIGFGVVTQAALKNINLSQVGFDQATLDTAFGDASVILPEGLSAPAHWPVWDVPEVSVFGYPEFRDEWERWRADPEDYKPPKPP